MPAQTSTTEVAASPVTCNAYQNLKINSKVFNISALPLDAEVDEDLALLARSRAILYTAVAMYIIDREGGPACQAPSTTREFLHEAAGLINRQHNSLLRATSKRVPGGGSDWYVNTTLSGLSGVRSRDMSWREEGRRFLESAKDQFCSYDAFLRKVQRKANESEVDLWLEATGGESVWRRQHEDAFAQLCGWYELESYSAKALRFCERQVQTIGRFWSGTSSS